MSRKGTIKNPESMEELNALRGFIGRKKGGRRGCLLAALAGLMLLLMTLYGLIIYRQRMLDLEAEAYLRAAQTATTRAGAPATENKTDPPVEATQQPISVEKTQPNQTATIAAELTSVVEFLDTLSAEP